jgi:hypothetical protein
VIPRFAGRSRECSNPLGASRVTSHADPHGTGSVSPDVRQVAAG